MLGVVLVIFFGVIYQENYIADATAYLLQLQRIVAPYITPDQRLAFSSRAAQLQGRSDFVLLVEDLVAVGKANNAKLPSFSIF
jgi:hypothetical protein